MFGERGAGAASEPGNGRGTQGRAGRPGDGRGTGIQAKIHNQWRLGPAPLLPNTLNGAKRTTGFPGRPHSAAPTFLRLWARAPPPATPTGNARGRNALGGCDCCSTRLGALLRGRSRHKGSGRRPPTFAGSRPHGAGLGPGASFQSWVRVRQSLSLRPSLSFLPRKWVQGAPVPAGFGAH